MSDLPGGVQLLILAVVIVGLIALGVRLGTRKRD